MIKAAYNDRQHVVFLLAQAFKDNQSANYVIRQDKYKMMRIYALMEYSFDMCFHFGEIYISDDRNGCALLLPPKAKRTNLRSLWLDIRLILNAISIGRVGVALKRKAAVKERQCQGDMQYVWFIGVAPSHQRKGIGTKLLKEILSRSEDEELPVCLETSTLKNLPWYEGLGFKNYAELDLGFKLFFLKRDIP